MASDPSIDDELLSFAFSLHKNPNSYALLLGAGVSMPSVPGAWDVLMSLVRDMAGVRGESDLDDPEQWYLDTFGEPARYDAVLEQIAPSQQERQQVLRGFFEPTDEQEERVNAGSPTSAHRSVARLVKNGSVRVIMTLNFDHLMETALRDEGIQPTVISTPAQMAGLAPLHTLQCCVIHLHGNYLEPASMLNTGAELAQYHDYAKTLMGRILQDYGLLAAGWSSTWDPGLRELIDEHYPNRYTFGWIEPHPLTDIAQQLLQRKRGTRIAATADTAFGRLADAVDALRTRGARHPLTVAVAAGTAKRGLAGDRTAISLHDTLRTELDRLHRIPEFNLPNYQDAEPYGGYTQVRERVEEQSRVVCALVASLGYWGTSNTDRWWVSEPAKFSTYDIRDGGNVALLDISRVTGTALFYAAGVAAVAAQRWELLFQLLRLPYRSRNRANTPLVDLSADRWARGSYTALLQYLHPIMQEALSLGHDALDDAWQLFEVLRVVEQLMIAPTSASVIAAFVNVDSNFQYVQGGPQSSLDQAAEAQASEERGRALGNVASLIALGAPHLFATEFDDPESRGSYTSPIVTALIHSLQDDDHPLIAASRRGAPELRAALQAVAVAIRKAADTAAYRGAAQNPTAGGGFQVPSSVWLDTEQAHSVILS